MSFKTSERTDRIECAPKRKGFFLIRVVSVFLRSALKRRHARISLSRKPCVARAEWPRPSRLFLERFTLGLRTPQERGRPHQPDAPARVLPASSLADASGWCASCAIRAIAALEPLRRSRRETAR